MRKPPRLPQYIIARISFWHKKHGTAKGCNCWDFKAIWDSDFSHKWESECNHVQTANIHEKLGFLGITMA